MSRPLTVYSDQELETQLEQIAGHVQYSYSDVLGEMTRRSTRRLTLALVGSTAVYALLTLVLVIVTATKS